MPPTVYLLVLSRLWPTEGWVDQPLGVYTTEERGRKVGERYGATMKTRDPWELTLIPWGIDQEPHHRTQRDWEKELLVCCSARGES